MKPINRSTFLVFAIGLLSLGFSACVPQQHLESSWQVTSPRINEGWKANNNQLQWHSQTGGNGLSAIGTQCYFCGNGIDTDGDGIFDNRDECANTPKGVRVYWQVEHFARNETPIGRPGCPIDSDLDGVANYLDSCPDTASDVKVDSKGCPRDSDRDRVYDNVDKCPNTPHGWEVDDNGCPLDSDGDGVLNPADKCPNTPIGAQVDKQGCWVLQNLNFSSGSDKIEAQSNPTLNRAVDVLANNPKLKIEIQGHTDSTASAASNEKLSMKRAVAVKNFLVSRGIPADKLFTAGFGASQPIADNKTAEGRAQNRRVVLHPLQ